MIYVRSVKDGVVFGENVVYVGRPMRNHTLPEVQKGSPLGNPYRVHTEDQRGTTIKQYAKWLRQNYKNRTPAYVELMRLVEIARSGDLTLVCWCSPLACHADFIKHAIEQLL